MPVKTHLPLLALLSVLAGGCSQSDEPSPHAGSARDIALPVYTHTVEAAPLEETVTATGSVLADEAVEITSEIAGLVTKVNFDEGSRVTAGDLLFQTNDAELRAELERAKAGVSLARIQAERQKKLLNVQGASQEAYDLALNELKVLEADAALIDARLAKTGVKAPFDGRIGLRHISEGAYLSPGAPVATLQKIDTLKIEFSVAERHMDRLREGAEVEVRIAGVAEPLPATVYAIEPRIDESTRTIRLRARAANPDGRILPGAFATVRVPLRTIPDALLVPAAAIIPGLNQQTVYVVEDGKAAPRTVQTGVRLDRDIQITEGLQPGDTVITSGQLQVRPGAPVRPVASPDTRQ